MYNNVKNLYYFYEIYFSYIFLSKLPLMKAVNWFSVIIINWKEIQMNSEFLFWFDMVQEIIVRILGMWLIGKSAWPRIHKTLGSATTTA